MKQIIIGLILIISATITIANKCPEDENFQKFCNCKIAKYSLNGPELGISCSGLNDENIGVVMNTLSDVSIMELILDNIKATVLKIDDFENQIIEKLVIINSLTQEIEYGLIGSINGLKFLRMENIKLDAVPDFSNATRLKSIIIKDCNIEEISPDDIAESNTIKDFTLTSSGLIKIHDKAFHGLRALKSLDLNNNNLRDLPQIFTSNQSIEIIDLRNNQLENFPENIFKNDKDLKELNLSNNRINNITENTFKDILLQGAILYLDNNKLICDSSLCWFSTLRESNYFKRLYIQGKCIYPGSSRFSYLSQVTSERLNC